MIKTASISKESAQQYLQSTLDTGAINLITPTLIGTAFRMMFSSTIIGFGIDLLLRWLGVDFEKILSDCCSSVTSAVQQNEDITPDQVQELVNKSVDSHTSSFSKESGYNQSLIIKIAASGKFGKSLSKAEGVTPGFLKKSLGFIFKTSLAAIGMQLFADFLKEGVTGGGNFRLLNLFSLRKLSVQKKFPVNKSYPSGFSSYDRKIEPSDEPVLSSAPPVTKEMINKILISWALKIYPTSAGDMSAFDRSSELHNLVEKIYSYNAFRAGITNYFYLQSDFSNKKEVVDCFIDNVASLSSVPQPKPVLKRTNPEAKKPSGNPVKK